MTTAVDRLWLTRMGVLAPSDHPIQTVADLADQALRRADKAALLGNCCELIGDLVGAVGWYRRQAAHLRIVLAASTGHA